MSHIYYSIIRNLLTKNNHIRGLAKELSTNQTTIARKIKILEENNIIDYKQEGKNKTYHIKETLESQEEILILEHRKLLEIIEKYLRLRKIIEILKENKEIKLAIFFGSYAKRNADKDSDIDIYIETKDKVLKKRIEDIDSKLSVKIGKFDIDTYLAKEIIKHHVIIKGVERFYEIIHQKINERK